MNPVMTVTAWAVLMKLKKNFMKLQHSLCSINSFLFHLIIFKKFKNSIRQCLINVVKMKLHHLNLYHNKKLLMLIIVIIKINNKDLLQVFLKEIQFLFN